MLRQIKDIFWVVVGAWFVNLIQVSIIANLNLFGGQPNLIAIGATGFLLLGHINLGLIWIGFGSGFFDSLLGIFGITTVPLLISYSLIYLLLRHIFNNLPWLATIVVGILLLASSEIVLAINNNNWSQFFKDLSFGLVILAPLTFYLKEKASDRKSKVSFKI